MAGFDVSRAIRTAFATVAAAAGCLLSGCYQFNCVSTCQAPTFTYTVFIGSVCARNVADALALSADVTPCEPGDTLLETACDGPDTTPCLFYGVAFPP